MAPSTTVYLQLMYACQAALASRAGYQSYLAIEKLQKYEETTKKLAKWSRTVEEQLRKTRTTQTAGALAVLASLIASVFLATFSPTLPPYIRFCTSPILLIIVLFARGHIKNYWAPEDGKTVGTRIPLPNMEDYNEAQRRTEELLKTLEYLEYGWVGTSFVAGMIGYN